MLVADLERPERFYYILTRSNWRSWLVWGAWFLTGHGAISALWLAAGWFGWTGVLTVLAWPAIAFAILATAYTGFLFAQGLGAGPVAGTARGHRSDRAVGRGGIGGAAAGIAGLARRGRRPRSADDRR